MSGSINAKIYCTLFAHWWSRWAEMHRCIWSTFRISLLQENQGKSERVDSSDRPSNLTQFGFWFDFQPVWPWNLTDDLEKQYGTSSILRQTDFFVPFDLESWWMTLQNNRALLLYHVSLCTSFQSHRWIQAWVTVRKRSIRLKMGDIFCSMWPWN